MYCPNCGKEIADETVVCVGCGRPVTPLKPISAPVQSVQGAGAGAKALHDTARAFLVGGILSIVAGIITTAVGWFIGIFTVIVGIIELVHAYQYWPTPPRKRTNATFVPILEMIGAIGGSLWSIFIGIANLNRLRSPAVKAYFQALQSGQPVDLITSAAVAGAPAVTSMKKCPSCGNNIPLDAKICQFCRHDFSDEDIQAAKKQFEADLEQKRAEAAKTNRTKRGKSLRVIGGIIGVIGILVLLLFILAGATSSPSTDNSGMLPAIFVCPVPLIVLGAGLFARGVSILRKLREDNSGSQPVSTNSMQ